MDAARFDGLTRSLSARTTRRSLGLLGGFGLAARLAPWDAAAKRKGKKRKKKRQPACRVSTKVAATTTTVAVTHQGLTLTNTDRIPRDSGDVLTSTTIIKQKRALLLKSVITFDSNGTSTLQFRYGRAFTGIARADLVNDGQTVSGTVDGRAIVPFPASGQVQPFQFQDGQPAPDTALSEELTQRLAELYAKAETQSEACAGAGARAADLHAERHTSLPCITCVGACAAGATICGLKLKGPCAAAAAICLVGAAACFAGCMAIGFAGCALAAVACVDICAREPCCAIPCHHTNGDTFCCEEGHTCLRPGACCAPGRFACQGQNCCASAERCMPGGACCEHPNFPCGTSCCGPFTGLCCNGVCCNGECINGSCCPAPGRRCGNTCCTAECCNGVCCNSNQSCISGVCTTVCAPGTSFCPGNGQCCLSTQTCCRRHGAWVCSSTSCTA
jgi:hypothetical protein